MREVPRSLVGCGILRRELAFLIAERGWNAQLTVLPSALHLDLDALANSLTRTVQRCPEPCVVVYGSCHPLIDCGLLPRGAHRTAGQNCVELLLGAARFEALLEAGSFFLFEDWAERWHEVIAEAFGGKLAIAYEVLRSEHRQFTALRTPVTPDYTEAAARIAAEVGLPLVWEEASLVHLEAALAPYFVPPEPP